MVFVKAKTEFSCKLKKLLWWKFLLDNGFIWAYFYLNTHYPAKVEVFLNVQIWYVWNNIVRVQMKDFTKSCAHFSYKNDYFLHVSDTTYCNFWTTVHFHLKSYYFSLMYPYYMRTKNDQICMFRNTFSVDAKKVNLHWKYDGSQLLQGSVYGQNFQLIFESKLYLPKNKPKNSLKLDKWIKYG